jgi:hypothetical protein
MPEYERCTCNFTTDVVGTPRPLIEIREYSAIPGDPAPLSRGVRALSSIKKGAIIGEYTGKLIHPAALEESDDYAFDFRPPNFLSERGNHYGEEQEGFGKTSNLTAQLLGNWVRFINQRGQSHEQNNCLFKQYTVWGG